jgi:hypothetical protein
MGRGLGTGLAVAVLATMLAAPMARATPSQEQEFVARINAERTARGLRAVVARADLTSVARRWSAAMAQAGAISHDPNLPDEVASWTILGDTVGSGYQVAAIHQAFMNSAVHRAVILRPDYNQVGVGIANAGDVIWVTQIFALRSEAAAQPPSGVAKPAPLPRAAVSTTGRVWDFVPAAPPMTVRLLVELVSLDAPVDPATGLIR